VNNRSVGNRSHQVSIDHWSRLPGFPPLTFDFGWSVMDWALDSDQEVTVRLTAVLFSCNDPGQVVHTYVPLSLSSIIQHRHAAGKVTMSLTSQ